MRFCKRSIKKFLDGANKMSQTDEEALGALGFKVKLFKMNDGITKKSKSDFFGDWKRDSMLNVKFKGEEYVFSNNDLKDANVDNIVEKLHSAIITKLYPEPKISEKDLTPTKSQIEKIVQNFHQGSIAGISGAARPGLIVAISSGPKILSLEIGEDHSIKMVYAESNSNATLLEDGAILTNSDGEPVLDFSNKTVFKATMDSEGSFTEIRLLDQSLKNEAYFLQKLEKQEPFKAFIKETKEDISNTKSDLLVSVLEKSNQEEFNHILGVEGQNPEIKNKEVANQLLEKTVFRQEILNIMLKMSNGKELLEEALTNSTVKYLDKEFKKIKGKRIEQTDKEEIVKGLKEISTPLKVDNLGIESLQLLNELDLDKLVTRSARESKDLKHSFVEKIKKYSRRLINNLSKSCTLDKALLDSFKQYVRKSSPEPIAQPKNKVRYEKLLR